MTPTGSREALKPPTPLEKVLRVMQAARRNDELMAIWDDDVKAVEEAITALSTPPSDVTVRVEEIRALVHKTAMSLPPSDFGSHRAIEAMTAAFASLLSGKGAK